MTKIYYRRIPQRHRVLIAQPETIRQAISSIRGTLEQSSPSERNRQEKRLACLQSLLMPTSR